MIPVFYGTVESGRLALDKRPKFEQYLATLKGRVYLEVGKVKNVRSRAENAYYHAVIVKMVADEMGVIPDEAHEFLKSLFLKKGIEHKGKRYEIARSTASLTVAAFEAYCEKCRQWAANELNCVIPLPNEIIID